MGTILNRGRAARSGSGRRWIAAFAGVGLVVAAGCGDDGDGAAAGRSTATSDDGDGPRVVVTTSILGDIVGEVLAGQADVQTLMPPGADPHAFSLSLAEASDVMEADLLVVNGLDFEEGLAEVITQAEDEGVEVFTFADHVSVLEADDGHDHDHGAVDGAGEEDHDHAEEDDGDHADDEPVDGAGEDDHGHAEDDHAEDDHAEDDHAEDDHAEDDHAEDEPVDGGDGEDDHADDHEDDHVGGEGHDGHDHGPEDPHIWTDPTRMVSAVEALVDVTIGLDGVDTGTVEDNGATYVDELDDLDTEIEEQLADVPADRRFLVTNHEVFGYFADRYDFEVVGTVIPSTSSLAEASQQDLEELVDEIEAHDVPAVFAEVSEDGGRAETVAGEAGDVEVVELHGESLGGDDSEAATYLDMMRSNATLIAEALS